jgi:DNA-binding SARP family transcriptional activator/TolB-like protein/Tfp pilus assembly protein PilF
MLHLKTFGGLSLLDGGDAVCGAASQRRPLALLALLAAAGPSGMSREKLLLYLWPESDEPRARRSLRQTLYSLRRDLDSPELVTGSSSLRLNRAVITSDIEAFQVAAREDDLERAVSLYTGPFLDGFYVSGAQEFERWTEATRESLAKQAAAALRELAARAERGGDDADSARHLERLAGLEPFDSFATLELLRLAMQSRSPARALQLADAYQRRLREELGAMEDPRVREAAARARAILVPPLADPVPQPPLPRPSPAPPERQLLSGPAPTHIAQRRWRPSLWTVALALPLVVAVVVATGRRPVTPARTVLAVLPFENTGPAGDAYLVEGMTDEIRGRLAALPGLQVIAGPSVSRYRLTTLTPRQIGRALGAKFLLVGKIRRTRGPDSADRVMVSPELIDAATSATRWERSFDQLSSNVFQAQNQVAQEVAQALGLALVGKDDGAPAPSRVRGREPDFEAYDFYLRGKAAFEREDERGYWESLELYRRALDLDPEFALPWIGIGHTWIELADDWVPPRDAYPKARDAALRAIALDSAASEAHVVLAWVEFWYDWQFEAAGREFERAIALNPSNAVAYQWYGLLLYARREGDSALAVMRRAEALDPLSGGVKADLARVLSNLGHGREASAKYQEALEVTPENGRFSAMWGDALLAEGRPAEAIEVYRQSPEFGVRRLVGAARAAAMLGRADQARRILGELKSEAARRYIRPEAIAQIYATLGESDSAFSWLDRAVEARSSLAYLREDRVWQPIRSDPRFGEVVRTVGLP